MKFANRHNYSVVTEISTTVISSIGEKLEGSIRETSQGVRMFCLDRDVGYMGVCLSNCMCALYANFLKGNKIKHKKTILKKKQTIISKSPFKSDGQ